MEENSQMEMEMVQIKGVDSTIRTNTAKLAAGARLVVRERLLTHGAQVAESIYEVELNGEGSSADVVSRSVAKGTSKQTFRASIAGNAKCSGHTECDAIIMDDAKILAVPGLEANDVDAALIHEAAIGKIARKYNLVTNFGKFMDPLADKLLVCSAMICLVDLKLIPSWIVIIIIAREFIISGFRLVASDNGVVIAASYWGKFKTTFQMLMIIFTIFNIYLENDVLDVISNILVYVALALTVISLIDYMLKNKDVLKDQK